jgi:hypothetical protein
MKEYDDYKTHSNSVISKLVQMIRDKGCDEDDLSEIMGTLYISKHIDNNDDDDVLR